MKRTSSEAKRSSTESSSLEVKSGGVGLRRGSLAALLLTFALGVACSAGGSGRERQGDGGISFGDCGPSGCFEPAVDCEDGEASFTIRNVGQEGVHLVGGPHLMSLPRPQLSSESAPGESLADECNQELDWSAEEEEPGWTPPLEETFECPEGSARVNIRDMWSSHADPSLNRMSDLPIGVVLIDEKWNEHGARQKSAGCDWYTTCLPKATLGEFQLNASDGSSCNAAEGASGKVDLSSVADADEIWMYYSGAAIESDYSAFPSARGFTVTADPADVEGLLCEDGPPEDRIPPGMIKLRIRYPWADPDDTGFAGTACGDESLGFSAPPYPTTLKVETTGCSLTAMLEFQNGHCPWYSVLIPEERWTGDLKFRYPDTTTLLSTPAIALPERSDGTKEYWLAYGGAPDDTENFGSKCMNFSYRANVYHFYTENPGPGYPGCGGGDVDLDPCNPPVPDGYSTVHFRYMWAGQKTFTYFPKPDFMPHWIVLEVNGGGGDKDIICYREEDRPWFNCPVPNEEFFEGAEWRATDKTRDIDWNTVAPRPFPSEPGEYWIRWNYGKPDIPETSRFQTYDYYPDGSHGDWSATGSWRDDACAAKPPPRPVVVGYDGWFPYDETGYAYPAGASLAMTFKKPAEVQDLLNAFVQERYEIWKENYLRYDDCSEGTARVHTEPPDTVSEGQGYGIAIAAAMGDKATFEKLWRFVRHFLSQDNTKYCGGLMGWQWKGEAECRPLDKPCNPDEEGCGGGNDSAFDGDVDIAIGLVYAALQWPEYTSAAVNWLIKMECMIDTAHDGEWHYATPGDTWNKNCSKYPDEPCTYQPGNNGTVNLSYYPPGYFRVFGDFLERYLDRKWYNESARRGHRSFWYRTAETVYEMYERCYDEPGVDPGLVTDWGSYEAPCNSHDDNYNWARALWRAGVDAAWFGNRTDLPETQPGSSAHFAPASRMQAKIDNIQDFFANFHEDNPPEGTANRFSTICEQLSPSGSVKGCDPALGHNSYFVNTAMTAFVPVFDNGGATTPAIRREAMEEAVTTTVFNDKYYQESLGVYTMLFLSGNFPNPMDLR